MCVGKHLITSSAQPSANQILQDFQNFHASALNEGLV